MKNNNKTTILVVEDEPFVQMLLADFLSELNYEVASASDAKSALAILESGREIALLLTDVGLPGTDGWTLAEAARAKSPALPVLFATGFGENHKRNEALAPGTAVISKPFDMERLGEVVRAMIPRAEA
jgi:CheY-like chemotaxis protein